MRRILLILAILALASASAPATTAGSSRGIPARPPIDRTQPSPADLGDGLVAYYSFTGDASDHSGNGHHGVVHGAALTADRFGSANRAYRFNGIDNDITVADQAQLDITGQITLAAWVYPTAHKTQEIMRKGPAVNGDETAPYGLALSAGGAVVFMLRINQQIAMLFVENYQIDQWMFVVGVYDGAEMKLYINGLLAAAQPIAGTLSANSAPLLIGTRINLEANTFDGDIDEVRLYNRALSALEVQQLSGLAYVFQPLLKR